jgi:hypothetical protein
MRSAARKQHSREQNGYTNSEESEESGCPCPTTRWSASVGDPSRS